MFKTSAVRRSTNSFESLPNYTDQLLRHFESREEADLVCFHPPVLDGLGRSADLSTPGDRLLIVLEELLVCTEQARTAEINLAGQLLDPLIMPIRIYHRPIFA